MSDPRIRQIKIKTGVLKRLTKEKTVYEKEVGQQKQRIEKLRGEGKDEHVMRKEEEILQEALMMIPDSHRRYANFNQFHLKNILNHSNKFGVFINVFFSFFLIIF